MSKFWRFIKNDLHLNGAIAEQTWWGDEVTPALFKSELQSATGNITVWINSPGGDVFAAAQIYNALKEYPAHVTVKIAGCFIKPHLRKLGIKFPHLFLFGERGSGKSTVLEKIILRIFGKKNGIAADQTKLFMLLKESNSSNVIPQAVEEFKPAKLAAEIYKNLCNHVRNTYDGSEGFRGKSNLSHNGYELLAPIVMSGENDCGGDSLWQRIILIENISTRRLGLCSRLPDMTANVPTTLWILFSNYATQKASGRASSSACYLGKKPSSVMFSGWLNPTENGSSITVLSRSARSLENPSWRRQLHFCCCVRMARTVLKSTVLPTTETKRESSLM